MFFCVGMPASPWQGAQTLAFASMGSWASALWLAKTRAANKTMRPARKGRRSRTMAAAFRDGGSRDPAKGKDGTLLPRPAQVLVLVAFSGRRKQSINREGDDVVPALKVDLG